MAPLLSGAERKPEDQLLQIQYEYENSNLFD